MAEKSKRFAALLAAFFFLAASLATSIAVIYVLFKSQNNKENTTSNQQPSAQNLAQAGQQLPNFTPVASVPELKVEDTKVGDGAAVKSGSTITFLYTGALAKTGKVFQSSPGGQPSTFPLAQLIPGWQSGLLGMKAGGTRRLYIPSAQAYGAQSPSADIPPNSDLVFDITLVNVQ